MESYQLKLMDFIIGKHYFEYGGAFMGNIKNKFYFLNLFNLDTFNNIHQIKTNLYFINKGNFNDYTLPNIDIFELLIKNSEFVVPFKFYISNNFEVSFTYDTELKITSRLTQYIGYIRTAFVREETF